VHDAKALSDHVFIRRRRWVQLTKKLNCPAKVKVLRVLFGKQESELNTSGNVSSSSVQVSDLVNDYSDINDANTNVPVDVGSRRADSGVTVSERTRLSDRFQQLVLRGCLDDFKEKYLYNLPGVSEHKYHNTGILAALTAPLDFRVREKVKELYREKNRGPTAILDALESYVKKELGVTDRRQRSFYPDRQKI